MIRRTRRDECGAVAVVVALTATFILVPVAALALDLGNYYVREAALQQIADDAATAGASELAVIQRDAVVTATVVQEVRAKTVSALCAAATGSGDGWPDACTGNRAWAGDGDEANGEVAFYRGAPTAEHSFPPTQAVTGATASEPITGIRVVTPPSRVAFGLAGSFTEGGAEARRTATAAMFTVLPRAGFLPMFLRTTDRGVFCTRSAPRTVWQPTAPSGVACNPAVARGNLSAARTNPLENPHAMLWNAASGFDRDHLPLPGRTATLQVPNPTSSLVRELSPGLFGGTGSYGAPARLKLGRCPGGYSTGSGPHAGLESAYLTSFANPRTGDKYALRDLIKTGTTPTAAQRGWLDPAVLRCGRLAVVPVLDGLPTLPESGLTSVALTYPVASLRLVWLDDRLWSGEANADRVAYGSCLDRGFYWAHPQYSWICEDDLRAYTGYILDPRLLPATVDGANATNVLPQYIGSGLPVTVRLLRDVADPPAR